MNKRKYNVLSMAVFSALTSVSFVMSANAAEKITSTQLDPIVVQAQREIAGGYMSTNAKVGMMPAADTMDIPYSSTTIKAKAIGDFAISGNNEMQDILSFSPSVRRTTSPDLVAVRGKQVSAAQMSINGINGLYPNMSTGLNFVDEINVISGPALLYSGATTNNVIGGLVNIQSKKATNAPITKFGLKYTGKGNLKETIDVGRRFGKNNEWGIRINAMNDYGNLAVYGEKLEQRNFFMNLDHRSSNSTTNILAGYAYSKHNGGNTIFAASGNVTNPGDKPSNYPYMIPAPDGKYNLNPSWYGSTSKTRLFAFNHEQKLGKNWSAFLNAGYMKNEVPISVSGSAMTRAVNFTGQYDGKFSRALTQSASATRRRYIGLGFKSEYDFGSVKNEFMIGVDKSYSDSWTGKSSKNLGTFIGNMYTKHTWARPDLSLVGVRPNSRATSEGINVVDTIKLFNDKLLISAGLHHQKYRTESYNTAKGTFNTGRDDSANCPTYGIVYKFTPDTMAYFNHSETFLGGTVVSTTAGYKNAGEILPPAKTKSNEIGVKFKTGSMLNTLSFYRCNEPGYMADSEGYYRAVGRTQYKGVEFSTSGTIAKKWDIMAGLSFSRGYVWKRNSNPNLNGVTGNGMPKWYGNLAVAYHPDEKVSILGRLSYIGKAPICYGLFTAPSYTRVDLGVNYKTTMGKYPVTLSAMCYNVLNKKGWYTADQGNQLLAADPRTFVVSAEFSL